MSPDTKNMKRSWRKEKLEGVTSLSLKQWARARAGTVAEESMDAARWLDRKAER